MWQLTNEFDGVITSSPLLTLEWEDKVNASVPLFNANAYLVPQSFAIVFSNLTTHPPPTQFPVENVLSIIFNSFFLSYINIVFLNLRKEFSFFVHINKIKFI